MACYHPVPAWLSRYVDPSTGRRVVRYQEFPNSDPVQQKCRQCVGCREAKSLNWATRGYHELQGHEASCFLTLTYRRETLPIAGTLVKRHVQLFMKKLRKKVGKVRMMYCGEYGDKNLRPHYHVVLFGYDFPDKVFVEYSGDNALYMSEILNSLWKLGRATIGDVTWGSIAYLARYTTKKMLATDKTSHYGEYTDDNGEVRHLRAPEFFEMSRRPGIGHDWLRKYVKDVFPSDQVVVAGGRQVPTPDYYVNLLEKINVELHEEVLERRLTQLRAGFQDRTPERLAARERVHTARIRARAARGEFPEGSR